MQDMYNIWWMYSSSGGVASKPRLCRHWSLWHLSILHWNALSMKWSELSLAEVTDHGHWLSIDWILWILVRLITSVCGRQSAQVWGPCNYPNQWNLYYVLIPVMFSGITHLFLGSDFQIRCTMSSLVITSFMASECATDSCPIFQHLGVLAGWGCRVHHCDTELI